MIQNLIPGRYFKKNSVRIFNLICIYKVYIYFIFIIISLNFAVGIICRLIKTGVHTYWPLNVFLFRNPNYKHLLVAIAVLILFYFIVRYLSKVKYKISYVIFFAFVLVLMTNLIQGWRMGFLNPIEGCGKSCIQYYHDAVKIINPAHFLRHFEQIQQGLLCHSQTHPPGAVLALYVLLKLLGNSGFISVAIAIISVVFSTLFLYGVLSTEFGRDDLSKFMTFLFVLIPSIQIYYAATIDALVATFLLGVLYFFMHPKFSISIIGSVVFLFGASFLTFGFVFILPVMFGFEILRRKSILKSVCISLCLSLIYLTIYVIYHFNYLNSFMIAFTIENPNGFKLLSNPASYVFTRLQDIFEIIIFLGPFLTILSVRGFYVMKKANSQLLTLTWLAIITLLAMLLTGAYSAGETARICLYIYPYLLFPVAFYLKDIMVSLKENTVILYLVFTQTVFMQLVGNYFW